MKIINNLSKKQRKERSGSMLICPSILSVKKEEYPRVINLLEKIKVSMLHLDVMDGVFVPNTNYNSNEVEKIKKQTSLILDTHLMISDVDSKIDEYILTKSDYITFHYEAAKSPKDVIEKIKKAGLKAGISIKPNTPVEVLDAYLEDLDLVLIMSVEPGFGGQKFIESITSKIEYLDLIRSKIPNKFIIEVDGGINPDTLKIVKNHGADAVVVGSYLMNKEDVEKTYKELASI